MLVAIAASMSAIKSQIGIVIMSDFSAFDR